MGVEEAAEAGQEENGGVGAGCGARGVEELDGAGEVSGVFVEVREDGDKRAGNEKGY